MKHAREDYNRIQDPDNIIPDDEPVFLIRAQDYVAPDAVRAWAELASNAGASDDIVTAALAQAEAMEQWHNEHGAHIPDLPHD